MDKDPVCVQCGEYKSSIRKNELFCCLVGPDTENGYGEVEAEWPRHRFKPYSKEELKQQEEDEQECIRQMGDFADWQTQEIKCACGFEFKRCDSKFNEEKSTFHCPNCGAISY